jgi:hypothetical protein
MALHEVPIIGASAKPGANVFFDDIVEYLANDLVSWVALVFADTDTKDSIAGSFRVPNDYSAATTDPKLKFEWTSPATAGDIDVDFDARSIGGNDAETLDPTTFVETVTVNDIAPGTTLNRMTAEITLTRANYAAGETVYYELSRDGVTESAGGMADVLIMNADSIVFEYADA